MQKFKYKGEIMSLYDAFAQSAMVKGVDHEVIFEDGERTHAGRLITVDTMSNTPFVDEDGVEWPSVRHINELCPNETPEGVPDLPHPWLAYVGMGPLSPRTPIDHDRDLITPVWSYNVYDKIWDTARAYGYYGDSPSLYYALDVRHPHATKYFPEIVEALNYVEMKTVREWLEVLPDGYRGLALGQGRNEGHKLDERKSASLADAIASFIVWAYTNEGHCFWECVHDWALGFAELPALPDQGYGYTYDGKKITLPGHLAGEWEIIPKGEPLPHEVLVFYEEGPGHWGMTPIRSKALYDFDSASTLTTAKLSDLFPEHPFKFRRAYARRKDVIAKGHNPDNLTKSQVGVSGGWRLLDADEVHLRASQLPVGAVELWSCGAIQPGVLLATLTRRGLVTPRTVTRIVRSSHRGNSRPTDASPVPVRFGLRTVLTLVVGLNAVRS